MFEKELESRISEAFNVSEVCEDFTFISRGAVINWSEVVAADINRIVDEKDFTSLKKNVMNVLSYDLESVLTSNVLDGGFVKLFRLAQLTIEYLLYIQNYFNRKAMNLSEEGTLLKLELEKFRSVNEYINMESVKNSQTVYNRQKESHLVLVGNEMNNTLRCTICGKVFLNGCYLYAHHQRRHSTSSYPSVADMPNNPPKFAEKTNRIFERETQKIWKELEWMRNKVLSCEYCDKNMIEREEAKESVVNDEMKRDDERLLEEMDKLERDEISSEKEKKEELDFEQNPKETPPLEVTTVNRMGGDFRKSVAEHMSSLHRGDESQKVINLQNVAAEDNGRLEAQERIWRGRLKALAVQSSQEMESLRKIISSLRDREQALEEEYQEKIEKLTVELKEQEPREAVNEVASTTDDEGEEKETVVPPIPSIAEGYQNLPSSRESAITTPPIKQFSGQESPNMSSESSASGLKSNASELESVSSDISSSLNGERSPSEELSEEEENESDTEMTVDVFGKKLRQLNVNPSARMLSDKDYKEKMDMLRMQRKLMKRNIENYHQIRSNLDEKADARMSQKLLKLNQSRRPEFPPSASDKESFVTTTARSVSSSHSQLSTGRTVGSKSSAKSLVQRSEKDLSHHPRLTDLHERPKSSQGARMTIRANVHPTSQESSLFPGVATSQTSGGVGGGYPGTGGSILRGLARTERERAAVVPSVGIYGSKSVSFAQDLVEGKIYRAV